MLAPECVVRVELEDVVDDLIALRARRWLIKCQDLAFTATWLHYANMQFELGEEPVAIRWRTFPISGDVLLPGGAAYRIDRSSYLQTTLRTTSGDLILTHKAPWKDSQTKIGVKWVTEVYRQVTDPYTGLAAGMLFVAMQIEHEANRIIGNGLSPFPAPKKATPNQQARPRAPRSIVSSGAPKADANEIPWFLSDERPGIDVVSAHFPRGLVKVERLGQTIFNPYGRHTRCVVDDWIAAVENPTANRPNVFSNAADITLAVDPYAEGVGISSATADFAGGDSFRLSHHEVAGWRLSCNGRSVVRHALPWKDSHERAKAQWVTYLEVDDYPWPGTGMALALFDILRARVSYPT